MKKLNYHYSVKKITLKSIISFTNLAELLRYFIEYLGLIRKTVFFQLKGQKLYKLLLIIQCSAVLVDY